MRFVATGLYPAIRGSTPRGCTNNSLTTGDESMDGIKIYVCKDGRTRVYIKDTKKVISYPKYIMEKSLGRELQWNEQVHHKDGNPLNNDIDNLEIKLLGDHQREHNPAKYHDKYVLCAWCGKQFLWTAKQQITFYGNNKRRRKEHSVNRPFCSKKCACEYGRHVQLIS